MVAHLAKIEEEVDVLRETVTMLEVCSNEQNSASNEQLDMVVKALNKIIDRKQRASN
jgi:hypothetical protein